MRPFLHNFGAIVLIISGFGVTFACQRVHSAPPSVAAAPASPLAAAPQQDAAWRKRAAVVNVDPGNSVTKRRSESTFTPRTSRASVDSHTSSLLVQVAALNHIVSIHKPLVEQQLRAMGLDVVGMKHSKLHAPNSFNVLVEDVTYVEEVEKKNAWDPVVYTLTPAIHVRVITANERSTFEAAPIMVRSYGTMSPEAADTYGRKLAMARLELGKRLVDWLGGRLSLSPAGTASSATTKPALPPAAKAPQRGVKRKSNDGLNASAPRLGADIQVSLLH
jgi:hypothetical protein